MKINRKGDRKSKQQFNTDGYNHRWVFLSKQARIRDRNQHRAQQQMVPVPGLWASGAFQNTAH